MTACSDSLVRVFDSRTGQCLMYEEYNNNILPQGVHMLFYLKLAIRSSIGFGGEACQLV